MKSDQMFIKVSLFLFVLTACSYHPDFKIDDLRVEYRSNLLGMDSPCPRFSWKITSDHRGVYQQSFQLIVDESLNNIKKGMGKTWDTGKIPSGQTVNCEYNGAPLQSNKKYYWRVRVWTAPDQSEWSDPAWFHAGILDETEWKAQWITPQEEIIHASPLLRKEFQIGKKIEQAFAYVTACGFYEFYLNGKKVGDHLMDPAITDYRKTILYSTYDVTTFLKKGGNVAGAMLGNGAWNLRKTDKRYHRGGASMGNPSFLMQMIITYTDGSQSVVISDNTWKYVWGPVAFNNLYGGEDYDARKEVHGWSSTGYNDSEWQKAIVAEKPSGRLRSQLVPPIRITNTIKPVKEINPSPGVYLYDLGQNIVGWWRVKVKGSPGQIIRIRGAETLNDSLFPKPLEEGDKLSIKFRYHSHTWTDYTLKGNETEVYEPRFFYTGFRYIEVVADDKKDVEQLEVEGRVVRSDLKRSGTFESSDSLLNKIYRAGLWSQMGNTLNYPTDCPHREKGAYNGDGQVIAETSIHDFEMGPFYTKWINDMRDAQEEDGRIPNTSPTLVGGRGGGIAWGSAYILIPWWIYNYYKDTRILKEHYPGMKKYLEYLKNLGVNDDNPAEPYIINNFGSYWFSLGEWCAPGQHDCPNHPVVSTFYYYYNSLLLSKIAEVLNYPDDVRRFKVLSDTIKQEFNRKFFNSGTFLYGTEETYQTYQLLALFGDLVPEAYRREVFQTIVDDIKKRDGHLNTGIIGTKYLWPILSEGDQDDLAFRLATQNTYPSYGYWISNGSTTLLEEWSGRNSHNHQMFGAVVEYFYKYLAGIQSPLEGNTMKGYEKIYIEPHVPAGLSSVSASLETVAGTVTSNWKKEKNSFIYRISVPSNTTATVALPVFDFEDATIWEGDSKIWENQGFVNGVSGILEVRDEPGKLIIDIGSGVYDFRMEDKNAY